MTEFIKTVTVIGTGYVGVTTAAILANAGYTVYAVDVSDDRLQALREGRSFFYEEGLNPLIKKAIDQGTLIPTLSYEESIPQSAFVFSCVGTPDNPDGSSNLTYIFESAKKAAGLIKPGSIYIQKSTVPVGTGRQVLQEFAGKNIAYVSNPEFLREGTALLDTLFFDRIVVGCSDQKALDKVIALYKDVEAKRQESADIAGIKYKHIQGEYIKTNLDSAELIKVTANAFLALKISFANSIAQLADQTEADVVEVMDAVGADPRIGRAFLNAGRGYGGGCFPKDVAGLISSAENYGVDLQIMKSASQLNAQMPEYIVKKVSSEVGGYQGKKVTVLGLAFKSGTSDARKSPGIKIANLLSSFGAKVQVYDPQANGEAKQDMPDTITVKESLSEATKDAEIVFIATDWPEFKNMNLTKLAKNMNVKILVDCMNCIDHINIQTSELKYIGVGR